MEEQREDIASCILGHLCLIVRGLRVAATGYRLKDLTAGDSNNRVVLLKKPEVAPPAFLYMSAAVRG